jgi:hypothetical protein
MSRVELAFSRGTIFSRDRIYVLAYSRNEQGTRVFRWTGKWDNYYVPFAARCIGSLAEPSPEIISLSAVGEVHVASPDGLSTELIDDTSEAPMHRGDLRCIKCIDRNIYVAGIGRQVYVRDSAKRWSRFDEGTLDPLGSAELVGFESIDGFNKDEIYAVGLNGEIWFCDKSRWRKIDTPTNVGLEKVLCTADGKVFAAGRSGVILCGRRDTWSVLPQDTTDDTFWDMAWFQGQLYLSTTNSLFVSSGTGIKEVNFGLSTKPTCAYLDANDGVLCSIGCDDMVIFDGNIWKKLPGV